MLLGQDIINISPDDIVDTFKAHVKDLTALSLGANLPNKLSVPHFISNGFKDILAIGLAADLKFKQLESATSAQAAAPAQAAGGDAPAQAAAAADEPAEEEDVSMGGLFD